VKGVAAKTSFYFWNIGHNRQQFKIIVSIPIVIVGNMGGRENIFMVLNLVSQDIAKTKFCYGRF
jgi:hypothetical protein